MCVCVCVCVGGGGSCYMLRYYMKLTLHEIKVLEINVNLVKHDFRIKEINAKERVTFIILLHEKFLQFDWLRAVVLQLNLKYL